MTPRTETAVVFDFDGVIVDSEGLHYRSLQESLAHEGVHITEQEYLAHYLAYRDRESIAIALERHGRLKSPETVERIAARKGALYAAGLDEVRFFDGARELVLALSQDYPMAVASGARRPEIEAGLRRGGMDAAFRTIVSAEDVSSGKPFPEPYLLALSRLVGGGARIEAGASVAVEDSAAGVASAKAAGMKVVAVTHSYEAAELQQADLVVPSLTAISRDTIERLGRG